MLQEVLLITILRVFAHVNMYLRHFGHLPIIKIIHNVTLSFMFGQIHF